MKKINSYITLSRASHFLGISQKMLQKMVDQHLLPFYRHPFNGGCMFKQEDLENFSHSQSFILHLKEKDEE
jgi:helix-turn-helix protein